MGRRLMALRRILHLDMDAFYASVEQRDDPSLRGKPVVVGGRVGERGVVAAASYEARAFGVRSAMPMSTALRNCPHLVVVRPDMAKYRRVSTTVFELFRAVTSLVEPLSMDEAYLDVTENSWHEPLGVTVARRLKQQVREATQLTISAGVAPNKFLAKIASGWKKPDGLTVIAPERMEDFLQKLPVDALWGVGPKTAARLRAAGIERLVDVRARDEAALTALVGSMAGWLRDLAHGIDERRVEPHRVAKSSGSEETYTEDLTDLGTIQSEVARMAEAAARWLAKRDTVARTVTLKLRYKDFTTITRRHSDAPTRDAGAIIDRAVRLVDKTDAGRTPVRLLGVSVSNFGAEDEPPPEEPGEPRLPFDT
jgi:DNA polymerase IV